MKTLWVLPISVFLAPLLLAQPADLGDATGQWGFNEDYGSPMALDATLNANDGVLEPTGEPPARIGVGVFGKALSFEEPEYVRVPDIPPALKPSYEYSISVWVRTTGSGRQEIVSVGNSYSLILLDGAFHTFYYEADRIWPGATSPAVGVNDGQWHHLVGQRRQAGVDSWFELWFDGELVTEVPTKVTPIEYDDPGDVGPDMHFGSWAGLPGTSGLFFNGEMDEVWLFDRPLNEQEVQTLWEANSLGPVFSCVGYEPPMGANPVTVRKKRALPLKAQLFDANGVRVTGEDIIAPVMQVVYESEASQPPVDVTTDALAVGLGTAGNEFEYSADGTWRFNLKSTNYTAPGTYTISMISGNGYVIEPTCAASFIIE